ncbi:hypothetical protein [Neisseria polysaccharea]|uniref:hypothetical protein n=1 Tax=Neisseria polysaccharea TaxID=489 RepID=UPI00272C1B7B|nr:hypothetical protein [Neisseria polysaccharea]
MPSEAFRQQTARSTPCGFFFLRISAAKVQTLKLPTPFFALLFFDTHAFVLFPAIPKNKKATEIYWKNSTSPPSFPRKRESRFVRFRLFPIDSCRVGGLDSRLCGNDGTLGFCFFVFVGMTNLNIVGMYRKFNIPP